MRLRHGKLDVFEITEEQDQSLIPIQSATNSNIEQQLNEIQEDVQYLKDGMQKLNHSQVQIEFIVAQIQEEMERFNSFIKDKLEQISIYLSPDEDSDEAVSRIQQEILDEVRSFNAKIRDLSNSNTQVELSISRTRTELVERIKEFRTSVEIELDDFFRTLIPQE